ncbi:hypothetical protein BGZ94_008602 [Podila epigama]|nr:hypothetical protein BGZ94_008602 [Podila epigama]
MGAKVRHLRLEFPDLAVSPVDGKPIVYGTPEAPAVIRGEAVLDCDYDCKCIEFKVRYIAGAEVKFGSGRDKISNSAVFDEMTIVSQRDRPQGKSHRIKAGTHRVPFSFTVKNSIPSSFSTEFSRVRFEVQIVLTRGSWSKDLVVGSSIHVVNSLIELPASQSSVPAIAQYQQELAATSGGYEKACMVRSCGIWSKIQPFELLYKTGTVYWGQQLPVTVRIFPPQNQGYALSSGDVNSGNAIVQVTEIEMVMVHKMSMRGQSKNQIHHLVRDVFREQVYSDNWAPLKPTEIWTTELMLEIPVGLDLTPSVNSAILLIEFEVQFYISCLTLNGRTIKVVPYVPLELTAPRPTAGDRSSSLDDARIEHAHYVEHFTGSPVLDFHGAPLNVGNSISIAPTVTSFDIPTLSSTNSEAGPAPAYVATI